MKRLQSADNNVRASADQPVRGATLLAPQAQAEQSNTASHASESRAKAETKTNENVRAESEFEWWWKPFLSFTALALFAVILSSAVMKLWAWMDRPVQQIQIKGELRHIEGEVLASSLIAHIDKGVLEADLHNLQAKLQAHPWVSSTQIMRDWPNKLAIQIVEEVPVARWGDEGLLNHEGTIFWPELKPEYANLPRLYGRAVDTQKVMAQFHDFNRIISQLGRKITELNVTDHGSWSFTMDNGVQVVIGSSSHRARLARFVNLYQSALEHQAHAIEGIDIRYENGAAIRWKQANATPGVRS
ncbi:MAG: cell division protein FtsQ/DivIB [Pontibacterium sp.]